MPTADRVLPWRRSAHAVPDDVEEAAVAAGALDGAGHLGHRRAGPADQGGHVDHRQGVDGGTLTASSLTIVSLPVWSPLFSDSRISVIVSVTWSGSEMPIGFSS